MIAIEFGIPPLARWQVITTQYFKYLTNVNKHDSGFSHSRGILYKCAGIAQEKFINTADEITPSHSLWCWQLQIAQQPCSTVHGSQDSKRLSTTSCLKAFAVSLLFSFIFFIDNVTISKGHFSNSVVYWVIPFG